MQYRAFSPEWVDACANQLRESSTYRQAGQHWHWPLLLVLVTPDAPDQMIYLDLQSGQCNEARIGITTDLAQVSFVLAASLATWQRVLTSQVDPIVAIMQRQLLLKKGSLTTLAMHAAAAKALVAEVAQVPTTFTLMPVDALPLPPVDVVTTPASTFITTRAGGLQQQHPAMQLFRKAKRLGIWNPDDIDYRQDISDWQRLTDDEQDVLRRLTSLFVAGEESVTLDLLPLIQVIAREGRLEEELFLTTFLWEEAKHVDFFANGVIATVMQHTGDLSHYHTPAYQRLFGDELPRAMHALTSDSSIHAQARASATYNMIVEGVLAETGYEAYFAALARNNLMPGIQHGITMLKRDESRHIAYGIFLLSRLIAQDSRAWQTIEQRLNELFPIAMDIIAEIFAAYPVMPFGLSLDEFAQIALTNFNRRLQRLEKARRQTLAQIYALEESD
jgi:ribonucleoside-diphosphate reductase beta chain